MKQTDWLRLSLLTGCGLFLLIPRSLFALDPARTVFQYNCQSWSRQNGLPAEGINAIAQTKDGFLWLGTQKGLVRFDGIEFKTFKPPGQLQFRSQIISTLCGTRNGTLWFGVLGGALGSYTPAAGFATPRDQPWIDPSMNVLSIRVPPLPPGAGWAYRQLTQMASGYSIVGVAAVVALTGGEVERVHVAVTGVGEAAYRARQVEAALMGSGGSVEAIENAAAHAVDGEVVASDIHADAAYRAAMAVVYTRRALEAALARAG